MNTLRNVLADALDFVAGMLVVLAAVILWIIGAVTAAFVWVSVVLVITSPFTVPVILLLLVGRWIFA